MSDLIERQVDAVNCALGIAILSDGQEVPITHMIDANGDFCGPSDAVSVVCGPDFDGQWYAVNLAEFTGKFQ